MIDPRFKRENNSITTNMYKTPTHTDQYLLWSSHHTIHKKLGMVRTLMHRDDTLIADEERQKIEKKKVRAASKICEYQEWALKEGELDREETAEKGARETESFRSY